MLMGRMIWLLIVSTVHAIDVNVTSLWRPDLGWEVTCTWATSANDTLQSVRLYNNGQQFLIYRPEMHGSSRSQKFDAPDKMMTINCEITKERGRQGRCTLILEPYQPPNSFFYSCEVSGERPMFHIGKKDIFVRALVPPTGAEMSATVKKSSPSHVMLNCSASGLPAPKLQWKVGDHKVEADFTEHKWNVTSKLWDVWSSFSYTRSDNAKVVCSPEINSDSMLVTGRQAEFSSAIRLSDVTLSAFIVGVAILVRYHRNFLI